MHARMNKLTYVISINLSSNVNMTLIMYIIRLSIVVYGNLVYGRLFRRDRERAIIKIDKK